jgi:hypothetical protein
MIDDFLQKTERLAASGECFRSGSNATRRDSKHPPLMQKRPIGTCHDEPGNSAVMAVECIQTEGQANAQSRNSRSFLIDALPRWLPACSRAPSLAAWHVSRCRHVAPTPHSAERIPQKFLRSRTTWNAQILLIGRMRFIARGSVVIFDARSGTRPTENG